MFHRRAGTPVRLFMCFRFEISDIIARMPIYEYRCSACGAELEALQKVSEAPLKDCPSCGKPALEKKLSAAGFQLKGSGWYATDFKGGAKKPDAKPAEAKPDTSTSTETKKTDTKSEAAA
jgi:putative FmdB family regulatory protein